MDPEEWSGGEAVVRTLIANGVTTIFGIPGVHTLPVYEAIRRAGLRHVLARHEQGAGLMAEGYARATGRIGVACVITGPGVTNIATAAASAFSDSIPLLIIASGSAQQDDERLRGRLHEVKNQIGVMQSLCGFSSAVTSVHEIPDAINNAIRYLSEDRPRGAYVEIPKNLLLENAVFDVSPAQRATRQPPDAQAIQKAAGLLRSSKRPLIVAGAGVTAANANSELLQLAELLSAPVIVGAKSHDVLPSTNQLVIPTTYVLQDSVVELAAKADVVLVIGSKLGAERTDYGRLRFAGTLIHVDIDEAEIGRDYEVDVPIVADAGAAIDALLAELRGHTAAYDGAIDARVIREARKTHAIAEFGPNVEFVSALDDVLPKDAIVSVDMTRLGYAAAEVLTSRSPRTFLHASELCSIGVGLPTAIGAKTAKPDQTVVALCGDGGFLLNAGELATVVQENLPVVIIVFNDHSFEAVKVEQVAQYGQPIATDLRGPDYVALAKAFGLEASTATTPGELQTAALEAFAHPNRSTLIEVLLNR